MTLHQAVLSALAGTGPLGMARTELLAKAKTLATSKLLQSHDRTLRRLLQNREVELVPGFVETYRLKKGS